MNRVFVLEPCGRYDLTAAKEYGYLVYLFPIDGTRAGMRDARFIDNVRDALEGHRFDAAKDFVVVAGTVALAAAFVATVAADYGRVNLLLFDAQERRYFPRTVDNARTSKKHISHG